MILVGLIGVKGRTISFTYFSEGFTEQPRHSWRHHLPAVFRYKDDVSVEVVDHMPSGAEVSSSHATKIHQDHWSSWYDCSNGHHEDGNRSRHLVWERLPQGTRLRPSRGHALEPGRGLGSP